MTSSYFIHRLTRDTYDDDALTQPLVDRIVAPCESVLQVSPPRHRKLEELRVVGGSPAGFVVLVVVVG
jgi:molecular chaperone DnaK (HSP70)